jgi:hypothetical protein
MSVGSYLSWVDWSHLARMGEGMERRKSTRYREILAGPEADKLPTLKPSAQRKIQQNTDGLLSIINNCETLKDHYSH